MNQLHQDLFTYIAQFIPDERDLLFISKKFYQFALELPDIKIWREHRQKQEYGPKLSTKLFIIMYGSRKMAEMLTPVEDDIGNVVIRGNINIINRYLDVYQHKSFEETMPFFTFAKSYGNYELFKYLLSRLPLTHDDVDDLLWYAEQGDSGDHEEFMIEYSKLYNEMHPKTI
jgi:hypothetical protein